MVPRPARSMSRRSFSSWLVPTGTRKSVKWTLDALIFGSPFKNILWFETVFYSFYSPRPPVMACMEAAASASAVRMASLTAATTMS